MCSQMFGPLHSVQKKREREKDGTVGRELGSRIVAVSESLRMAQTRPNEALRLCTKILK